MSCREWKEYLLEDVVDKFIDYRGKTPKKTEFGIPLITAKIIKDGFIQKANEFISEDNYLSWMTRGFPQINDVVMTTEAPLGEVAQIKTNDKIALAQRIITMRGKKEVLDNTYLKYFLQSNVGQSRLYARATGTTVIGIKSAELKKVSILMPKYYEQKAIAATLSCLDDMIELNNRTDQVLEEMAQAIFKHWFVDFEFPNEDGLPYKSSGGAMIDSELGEIPEGWKVGTLKEICNVNMGQSPPSSTYNTEKIGMAFFQGVKDFGSRYPSCTRYCSEPKKIAEKGDILLSVRAPVGEVNTAIERCCIGRGLSALSMKNMSNNYLHYLILNQKNGWEKFESGSVFTAINKTIIENLPIVDPPRDIVRKFNTLIQPIDQKNPKQYEGELHPIPDPRHPAPQTHVR